MCTEKYAKRVANKTSGLVDIALFFQLVFITLFICNIYGKVKSSLLIR